MTKFIIDKIVVKIGNLRQYLSYLRKIKSEVSSQKKYNGDFRIFGNTERYIQLSVQCLIDVCHLILSERGLKIPAESREAVSILRGNRIISEKNASNLIKMIGMRNILVHEYGEIDNKKVYNVLKNRLEDFEIFEKEIIKYLGKLN
jgi:uncharacterized protein YutE (UPF0331/DUF86 family)